MNIKDLELHDALLTFLDIDYADKKICLQIQCYETEGAKYRSSLRMTFRNVGFVSQISDLNSMAKNAFAGNINYWVAGDRETPTYIYFTDGCLVIKADEIELENFAG